MRSDPVTQTIEMIRAVTLDENILRLLELGWYVPQRIRLRTVFDLGKLILDGQGSAAEDIIDLFFRRNIKALEDYLLARYPDRPALGEAFRAYEKRMFGSCVLLMLTATRGICIENLAKITVAVSDPKLVQNRKINSLLDLGKAASGFFSEANRSAALNGGMGICGQRECFMAMAVLAFITDFNLAYQSSVS